MLTDADRDAAFHALIADYWIEWLDTRLGTADVVQWLKGHSSHPLGSVSTAEDGPYPEFSRWIERCPRGAHVRVYRNHGDDGEKLLREGYVTWTELANRTTVEALTWRAKQRLEVEGPGGQLPLFA